MSLGLGSIGVRGRFAVCCQRGSFGSCVWRDLGCASTGVCSSGRAPGLLTGSSGCVGGGGAGSCLSRFGDCRGIWGHLSFGGVCNWLLARLLTEEFVPLRALVVCVVDVPSGCHLRRAGETTQSVLGGKLLCLHGGETRGHQGLRRIESSSGESGRLRLSGLVPGGQGSSLSSRKR